MKIIIIEDQVYEVTEYHFKEIERVNKSGNENDLIELFENRIQYYKLLGYVSFSFRG